MHAAFNPPSNYLGIPSIFFSLLIIGKIILSNALMVYTLVVLTGQFYE
jgi:hypothetical protein